MDLDLVIVIIITIIYHCHRDLRIHSFQWYHNHLVDLVRAAGSSSPVVYMNIKGAILYYPSWVIWKRIQDKYNDNTSSFAWVELTRRKKEITKLKNFIFSSSLLLTGREAAECCWNHCWILILIVGGQGDCWILTESHWFIYFLRLPHQDGDGFPCAKHNGAETPLRELDVKSEADFLQRSKLDGVSYKKGQSGTKM